MPANECIPFKEPGISITAKASADVKGKTFLKISGDRTGGGGGGAEGAVTVGVGLSADAENVYKVATAAAKGATVGVAAWDALKGEEVKVFAVATGIILPIIAGADIAAGEEVESDAEGKAIPLAAGKALGLAMTKAAKDKDAEVKLY